MHALSNRPTDIYHIEPDIPRRGVPTVPAAAIPTRPVESTLTIECEEYERLLLDVRETMAKGPQDFAFGCRRISSFPTHRPNPAEFLRGLR